MRKAKNKNPKRKQKRFHQFPIQICQRTINSPGSYAEKVLLQPVQQNVSCSATQPSHPAPRFPASMLHANEDVNLSLGCSSEPAAATPAVTAFNLVNLSKSELRQNRERERESRRQAKTDTERERGGEWEKCTEQVAGKHTLTQIRLELKVLTEFNLDFVYKYFQKFLHTLQVSILEIYI